MTTGNCSELRGSADYSAYCGGAAKHEFPKQTVAVPSNVNSYDHRSPSTMLESAPKLAELSAEVRFGIVWARRGTLH